jgi:alkylation response protein AidB-like acyl-CoA dehydrogenase
VDFELTDEQLIFQRAAADLLEAECPITAIRALEDDPNGFDAHFWRQAAGLGWMSPFLPEVLGGGSLSGNPVADLAVIAEEVGRHIAPGPLVPVNVVIAALARSGTPEQQAEVLPELAAGEEIASWAFAEADSLWDPAGFDVTAEECSGGYLVNGTKRYVEAAFSARYFLVTARTGRGLSQVLVPRDARGLSVVAGRSVDLVRRFGDVRLDGTVVPKSALIGAAGAADADVTWQLDVALALQVAELVGIADFAFALTLGYLNDRWSFGRPLSSYQALKHRIADMLQSLETAKGCAEAAARAVGMGEPDASLLASVAKAYVGRVSTEILSDCVQLHGGIALTWEHDMHLYERRVAVDRAVYGTPEMHCERVCRLLADEEDRRADG